MKKVRLIAGKAKVDEITTAIAQLGCAVLFSGYESDGWFNVLAEWVVAFPDEKEEAFKASILAKFVKP